MCVQHVCCLSCRRCSNHVVHHQRKTKTTDTFSLLSLSFIAKNVMRMRKSMLFALSAHITVSEVLGESPVSLIRWR